MARALDQEQANQSLLSLGTASHAALERTPVALYPPVLGNTFVSSDRFACGVVATNSASPGRAKENVSDSRLTAFTL